MSQPEPSTSTQQQVSDLTVEQTFEYSKWIVEEAGYKLIDNNVSMHANDKDDTPKGKSLLKEPPVFDGDKKKY